MFLQGDELGIKERRGFGSHAELGGVRNAVGLGEEARDECVHIDINAALFQLKNKVIKLVQLTFAEDAGLFHLGIFVSGADVCEDAARLKEKIHMVQAYGVEAEIGNAFGQNLGLFFVREAGVEAEVGAPEAGAGAVFKIEVAVLDLYEPVFTGRRV